MKLKIILALCAMICTSSQAFVAFTGLDGVPYRWVTNDGVAHVTWKLADPSAPDILRASILYATEQWSKASNGAVVFEESPDGAVVFTWDNKGVISDTFFLAYTSFTVSNHDIASAAVVINAHTYKWTREYIVEENTFNLDGVILHELGHVLGLDHSDKKPEDIVGEWSMGNLPTMNSVLYPGAETLHSDDIVGIIYLYSNGPGWVRSQPTIIAYSGKRWNIKQMALLGVDTNDIVWTFGDRSRKTGYGSVTSHKYRRRGAFTVTASFDGQSISAEIFVQRLAHKKK